VSGWYTCFAHVFVQLYVVIVLERMYFIGCYSTPQGKLRRLHGTQCNQGSRR